MKVLEMFGQNLEIIILMRDCLASQLKKWAGAIVEIASYEFIELNSSRKKGVKRILGCTKQYKLRLNSQQFYV